jgi:hypothetical protein
MELFGRLLAALAFFVLGFGSGAAHAQTGVSSPPFDQQVLDELLAPIALYPDVLLTQVLIASTYPLEVVQAARLVDRSRDMAPDALASVAEAQPWDPSVIALVRFPSVLAMMDDKLDWTQKLGDAFLAQQADVMDTVQALRARAQAAGNLDSNPQQTVVLQDRFIVIEPTQPQFVYVPFFNPMFVYGNWWWGAPPRWVWVPPPRFQPPGWGPGWGPGIGWGRPIGAPPWLWHGRAPNWQNRNIVVNNTTIINNNNVTINKGRGAPVWTHNPGPRRGVSDPRWREGPPPGATRPSGPDRTRPGGAQPLPERTRPSGPDGSRPGNPRPQPDTRPAPTRPGLGSNAPQATLPTAPTPPADNNGGRHGSRPGSRPPPGDAGPPTHARPPRAGAPAANPEAGRPARPVPSPPRQAPAADVPGAPGTRPVPPERPRGGGDAASTRPVPPDGVRGGRDSGSARPGGISPARATP